MVRHAEGDVGADAGSEMSKLAELCTLGYVDLWRAYGGKYQCGMRLYRDRGELTTYYVEADTPADAIAACWEAAREERDAV